MKTSKLTLVAIAGSFIALTSMTTSASACQVSTWNKTSGSSLVGIINGRDCGGSYSARFIGFGIDSGWVPMYKNGMNSYKAEFGNGQALSQVTMNTNGATMSTYQKITSASGAFTGQASYHLTNMQ